MLSYDFMNILISYDNFSKWYARISKTISSLDKLAKSVKE